MGGAKENGWRESGLLSGIAYQWRGFLDEVGIARRNEVVFAAFRNGPLADAIGTGANVARGVGPGEFFAVDYLLQFHQPVEQRLGAGRTAWHVNIDRDEAVNPLEHVVALLERPAGNGAGTHGEAVFWLGHLVPDTDHLRGHFFGDGAADDHQVSLAWRGAEDLGAEAGDIKAGGGDGDHLNRAAGEAELERPDGVGPAPIVNLVEAGDEDASASEMTVGAEEMGTESDMALFISIRDSADARPIRDPRTAKG